MTAFETKHFLINIKITQEILNIYSSYMLWHRAIWLLDGMNASEEHVPYTVYHEGEKHSSTMIPTYQTNNTVS
jgi:hypothetical protein